MTSGRAYKNPISKYVHEYMYWKKAAANGPLPNAHYQAFFTDLFGVDKAFYTGKRVLDVGCGPCGSLEWADNAARRVGLDPLAEAYEYIIEGRHAMEYTPDFAESISFPDASFDIVTSINSLDHVDHVDEVAAEIARVTAPGGAFLLMVEVCPLPKPCEPSPIPWDFAATLAPWYTVQDERRYAYTDNVTASVRAGKPFDPAQTGKASGVLRLILRRNG